jgi:hypothetical protein
MGSSWPASAHREPASERCHPPSSSSLRLSSRKLSSPKVVIPVLAKPKTGTHPPQRSEVAASGPEADGTHPVRDAAGWVPVFACGETGMTVRGGLRPSGGVRQDGRRHGTLGCRDACRSRQLTVRPAGRPLRGALAERDLDLPRPAGSHRPRDQWLGGI